MPTLPYTLPYEHTTLLETVLTVSTYYGGSIRRAIVALKQIYHIHRWPESSEDIGQLENLVQLLVE